MFSSLMNITLEVGHLQWLEKILLFLTKLTQSRKLFLLTLIITIYFDLPYVYFGNFKLKHYIYIYTYRVIHDVLPAV